ncbi:MAG: NUDIX domain-containing protein, partial [Clostridia bacterium]|nr:NUDIX domain-containing protein [Clostridia bacterium]
QHHSVKPYLKKFAAYYYNRAAEWGAEPHHPETVVHRSHIFTHVEWEMTGISIRCNREAQGFAWADREERAGEYALPTAFRQFLEE